MQNHKIMATLIDISQFDYPLPEQSIAKYPLEQRHDSKLLAFQGGEIRDYNFTEFEGVVPSDALFVFNRTKVVKARLHMVKPSGAKIEVFCLEPAEPAEYYSAFAAVGSSSWHAIIGNAKRFKGAIHTADGTLRAERGEGDLVHFSWDSGKTFGEILEAEGQVPIPPYLKRSSQEIDSTRYQTTYAQEQGSVAAPTAGLHFDEELIESLPHKAFVTLHVGAGTFLPVKEQDAAKHTMHTETFSVTLQDVELLAQNQGNIIAVGTTSLRTIESLSVLGGRILQGGTHHQAVGQWERYEVHSLAALRDYMVEHSMESLSGATQIMITPGYKFSTIRGLVTNFHQPRSTLLLLISAVVGDAWKEIYSHAMDNGYRFLSYGDSSYLELTPQTK